MSLRRVRIPQKRFSAEQIVAKLREAELQQVMTVMMILWGVAESAAWYYYYILGLGFVIPTLIISQILIWKSNDRYQMAIAGHLGKVQFVAGILACYLAQLK